MRSTQTARAALAAVLTVVTASAALAAAPAAAGTISPDLADAVRKAAPGDEIAVLVRLADRLDVDSVAAPPGASRRHALVAALKNHADAVELPVRRFLDARAGAGWTSLWAIGGIATVLPAGSVIELAGLPSVAGVRLDRSFELGPPAPAVAADAGWNLEAIGAADLWAAGFDGENVVVAMIDSGVDADHSDLGPSWRGGANSWFDPHGEHPEPHDADGHGTQVAGLIVGGAATGTPLGIAPGARWIAGKIYDDSGQSTFSATHEVFQWLLDPDGDPTTDDAPHVVNGSWGFRNLPGECVDEFGADIQLLRAAGIMVVFSAGNAGPSAGTSVSPGNNAGVVAVGGSDPADEVMSSSSRGPSACDGSVFPSLVAPGDGVRTADLTLGGLFPDSTVEVSGTSFAAPHVAGAVALLLDAHPGATADQVEDALRTGAEDLGPDGPDNDSGHGRLDLVAAEAALASLVGPGNAAVYTDEGVFLAALAGIDTVAEGFEDDAAWGASRSPAAVASVASQGITWSSNHDGNEVTTGFGPARTGDWGFYSWPHGDQTVTQPTDFITDGFTGAGSTAMNAVGGWFVAISGARLSLILDGDEANPIDLGPVGISHGFLGVVVDGSFGSFEFRETEGTVEDPKLIFVDDVTVGLAGGSANRPPVGTIVQPAGNVTVTAGEAVFFEATASDPDGDPVTVLWDFGDGTTSTALTPGDHVYATAGSYPVTLTATDGRGLADPTPDRRTITVLPPQAEPTTGVVAGVANLPGALGSDWHSDLFLHNAGPGPATVSLRFSRSGGLPGSPATVALAADETVAVDDVVGTLFGTTGSGAILWTVESGDAAAVLVSANTFNRVDASRRYGQQVPGVRWADAAPAGTSLWVPALAGRYRTNLGFATGEGCTGVTVRGYDRSGAQVAQRLLSVAPLSWVQLNGLFRNVFPDLIADPDGVPVGDSLHRFEVVCGNGSVVAYTSLIDNVTSDGSYLLGQVGGSPLERAWLPGAARISGVNGSRWRSDVVLMHVGGTGGTTEFSLLESGAAPGGAGSTRPVTLEPDRGLVLEDILGTLFDRQPPVVGSLVATYPAASSGLAWMRTYTEEPAAGGTRTYGQAIAVRAPHQMIPAGGEGRIVGFSHDQGTRSNLILQNTRQLLADNLPANVLVEVLDADGRVLGQRGYQLAPGEYLQHNRFLDDYGIPSLSAGTVRVTLSDQAQAGETGGLDAMISEVNGNLTDGTNDGRLIRAQGPGLP